MSELNQSYKATTNCANLWYGTVFNWYKTWLRPPLSATHVVHPVSPRLRGPRTLYVDPKTRPEIATCCLFCSLHETDNSLLGIPCFFSARMSLLLCEDSNHNSDKSALLECTDDEKNYSAVHAEKNFGASLQLVNVSPISGVPRESRMSKTLPTGKASISELVFNLIKNIVRVIGDLLQIHVMLYIYIYIQAISLLLSLSFALFTLVRLDR